VFGVVITYSRLWSSKYPNFIAPNLFSIFGTILHTHIVFLSTIGKKQVAPIERYAEWLALHEQ
jgi:hypothetical protein